MVVHRRTRVAPYESYSARRARVCDREPIVESRLSALRMPAKESSSMPQAPAEPPSAAAQETLRKGFRASAQGLAQPAEGLLR